MKSSEKHTHRIKHNTLKIRILPPPSGSISTAKPDLAADGGVDVEIRIVDQSHEEQIIGLDKLVTPMIKSGMYHHSNLEVIGQCLSGGLSLGLFEAETLVGYRLTFVPGLSDVNLGRYLDLTTEQLMQVAQLYGTLLSPNFRGQGVGETLMNQSLRLIFDKGFRYALVTVHPANKTSLAMCLRCGFDLVKEITFYGGLPRLLLRKMITRTQLTTNL